MNITMSGIFAGVIFSGIGMIALRRAKLESNIKLAVFGILLILYSYFTKTALMDWGVGLALTYGVYHFWHG